MGSTPSKHITNRDGHNRNYDTFENKGRADEKRTKNHTNADHPNYWKVQERTKTTSDINLDYDEKKANKYINKHGTPSYSNTGSYGPYTDNPDYDASAPTDTRTNRKKTKYYASDKDREIQETRHKKKGGGYIGDEVYTEKQDDGTFDVGYTGTNTADRVGKTDGNTYKTGSKSKSKTKTKSKKGKLPSYEESYTASVAEKWKDKGGKEAYIKAAKAYNAKKRK